MKLKSFQNGIGQIFFTADQHFGHRSVIGMCNREFDDVDQMDREMVEAWNSVVGPRDVVFHLGDFAHRADPERARKIFYRLNGQKHLILGNHDRKHTQALQWTSQQQMLHLTVDNQRLHLCHYGMRVWPGMWRNAVHLYGHSHGRLPGNRMSMDVGVDSVGYYPVTVEHIQQKLLKLPVVEFPEDLDEGDEDEIEVLTP
ncbi:metallophosphoesterase family protein [Devosia sp. A449]